MKKEDFIDYLIKTAWHSLSRLYNKKAQTYGVTTSAAFVLLNISTSEGTAATKIAPSIGLEARSLTRMLKTLEEDGYIYRAKDKNDRRSVRIHLTEQGKLVKIKAIDTIQTFNAFVQEKIDPAQLDVYMRVSEKIIEMVEHSAELKNRIEDV